MSKDIHTLISEVKEALEKATPGQWEYQNREYGGEIETDQTVSDFFNFDHWICQLWFKDDTPMQNHKANGHLIANAPTWLQQLVTGLEEAHRDNEGSITKKKLDLALRWLKDIKSVGSATSMLASAALHEIEALEDQYPLGSKEGI